MIKGRGKKLTSRPHRREAAKGLLCRRVRPVEGNPFSRIRSLNR
jgi:hypothetical protein